tara:strand:+ start:6859 stop:10014 length:3156 start_codon:yes stop_codon:yes gene_type:complete
MNLYYGVVENRQDPLRLGRCQVRIVGLHTHDKNYLPSLDLPWALPVQPIGSAAMNGIGFTPVGPVEGTSVVIMFADDDKQQPIILGTVGGVPNEPGPIDNDDASPITCKLSDIQLRTIVGPVTGTTLTFVDNVTGDVNLTKCLAADMGVIGFGIPEGTKIVSILNGTRITISNTLTNYGENLITFSEVPSNLAAVRESSNLNVVTSSSGQPVTTGSGDVVTSTPNDNVSVPSSAVNDAIPLVPPPKSTSDQSKSTTGIKALLAACDKVGLTTKEQKCAILGIAGGESRWIPQLEAYNYSEDRLKQIYSFATAADVQQYARAPKKGISRTEFFSWAYGPTKRGKGFLGNLTDADGGKYYGRGFIQLTGRANYQRYQDLAAAKGVTVDIVNNPDSLDGDIEVSALIAVLYFVDRVSSKVNPNDNPGWFYAAKKAVGVNSPDIAAVKLSYYEYFYGSAAPGAPVKDAAAVQPEPATGVAANPTPGPSPQSIQRGTDSIGFRDPNSKYPLKAYLNEPDTNRLARGVIDGTVVRTKDGLRVLGIPKGIVGGTFDQPEVPYGAKYPFNKVYESESGHIQEFDDTPGQERIHTFHRSGTYSEVDANGTQVNYIVGDNYILMERNGCIHVAGECNITVDGNTNIFARSDANIEVAQNANVKVGNNLDIGVATDVTMAVGGDFKLNVAGDYSVQAANINTKASETINTQAVGAMSVKSETLNQQTTSGMSIKAATINQEASGSMDIKSGGVMSVDYSQGKFGEGANGATGATDVETFDLAPPAVGVPLNSALKYLVTAERNFEENTTNETPDDYDTPEGRADSHNQTITQGVVGAAEPVASEEATATTGGTNNIIPVDCKIIYTTKNFTNDYTMSKNFTLGMMMDGGVNGRHKIQDQNLQDVKNGPSRIYTTGEIVCNLAMLAQNMLEPMLEVLPGGIGGYKTQWKINSGYRLRGLVGNESPTSDHCKGMAIDIGLITPGLSEKIKATFDLVQQIERVVPYNQLILEYRNPQSVWIHASFKMNGNRKMAFTMVNDRTYKRNSAGVPAGFYLVDPIPPKSR